MAEQFLIADGEENWPAEVTQDGSRYFYTPWVSMPSHKRIINDTDWLCCEPPPEGEEGFNYVMTNEDFIHSWEPSP
jgi:hypothetical protein